VKSWLDQKTGAGKTNVFSSPRQTQRAARAQEQNTYAQKKTDRKTRDSNNSTGRRNAKLLRQTFQLNPSKFTALALTQQQIHQRSGYKP
jgi:hypothetical protein